MSDLYVDYIDYGKARRMHRDGVPPHVLNPALFKLLRRRIGPVGFSSPGEPASKPEAELGADGVLRARYAFLGEYYKLNCSFCNDTHQRLYVSHLWCTKDPFSGARMRHLATCYNEDCLHQGNYADFEERVFGWEPSRAGSYPEMEIKPVETPDGGLREVELPGDCPSLTELPSSHPALRYLAGRGFDPASLAKSWDVRFCRESFSCREVEGRIVVPIRHRGKLVGWQGRFVGDRDWKKLGLSKYYTMPGLHKSQLLYNLDRAATGRCLVLVEGVSDAWKVGRPAVALLGKAASRIQCDLLGRWVAEHDGRVILAAMLDPDARGSKPYGRMLDSLRELIPGTRLVEIPLPDGVDPGKLSRPLAWSLIDRAVTKAGHDPGDYR